MPANPIRRGLLALALCLPVCAFTLAQDTARIDWSLSPFLVQGQELVYSGWYTEKTTHAGVHHERAYRFETTLFVQDSSPRKWDVAVLTALSLHTDTGQRQAEAKQRPAASVRLEAAEFDRHGRLLSKPAPFAVSLNGPPTLEWGAIIEAPHGRDKWETKEDGRPACFWQQIGKEDVKGNVCVKIVGVQQSEDWDLPRAEHTAWRRRDTLWLMPQLGVAFRVERLIERREPARKEATQLLILQYELEGRPMSFRGQRFDDRQYEIQQARKFWEEAAVLLRQPAQYKPQLEAALKKIAYHLEHHHPTPYRQAVVQVQKRLEAARRGEAPPEIPHETEPPPSTPAAVGQKVADFVTTDFFDGKSVRLQHLLGRPIVLLFYKPHTETGAQVLRFVQALSEKHQSKVTVVGMAVSDNTEFVRKQYRDMRLTFPILDGQGLHQTFGVDATPRLIILDGEGVLRGAYTGWGAQTPGEITEELRRWLPK